MFLPFLKGADATLSL